ncbi:MAG: flagellar assembly protein A [Fervidobacterium gondwanense]
MDIIKAKEITEVFDEIEKRYGQTWYEIVAVEIQTDEHGEIKAVVKPLHGKFHPQTAHRDVERVKVKETVQDLLNVETLSALEDKVKEYENFKVNVTISDDEMKAFVTIIPGIINEMPTKDELAEALFNAGVVFGIKQDVLERIVNEKMTYQPILVAEGKEPQPPEDAKIDYKFKFLTGDLIEPGEEIPYCLSGQILAEKIPAIPGTPGHTVTGKELPARQGKDFDLRAFSGQNTKIEGDKIVATVSGQPYIDEQGRVCVKEVLVLSEKEISSQKSFDFPGSIMVNCGLDGNYRINSGKDVFIKGIVSGHVEINASGNVYINGGFFGRKVRYWLQEMFLLNSSQNALLFQEEASIQMIT